MTQDQLQQLRDLQKQVGDQGEDFVLRYERQRLWRHPRCGDIRIIGRKDVGMGYDILSFQGVTSQTHDLFIEVKTFTGGDPHFFLSQGEEAAAAKYGSNFAIYLVDVMRINEPDYRPLIIPNPIKRLNSGRNCDGSNSGGSLNGSSNSDGSLKGARNDATGHWEMRIQQKLYYYVDDTVGKLPGDFFDATVLVGCYNGTRHHDWIKHCSAYNVRQGSINGAVTSDDVTEGVDYLLLYDGRKPRNYSLHKVKGTRVASKSQMLSWNYPEPHAQQYILYNIGEALTVPPLDIMALLRSRNDKLVRTSGTPIYMSGREVSGYSLGGQPTGVGASVRRTYTNEGKPWTQVATEQLRALYLTGTSIASLTHRFKRTAQEIRQQLQCIGITPP